MSCPVTFDAHTGMWRVRDPAQVRAVLQDPDTFRPDNALTAHTPLSTRALRILAQVGFTLPPTLANNATDSHRPIRKAVAGFFSPGSVQAVEPLTRTLTASRIAHARRMLAEGDDVDLAGAVADVPAIVLLELLGLTDVDVTALKRWSIDSLELFWGWPGPAEQKQLAISAAQFYRWLRERTTAARRSPVGDLFGRLLHIGLSDEQICGVAYFLLIAGHETTSQLVSTAYLRLIADPVGWDAIGRQPSLAARAVEAVLAEQSSVPTWRRITATSTQVGNVEIPPGAPLLLHLTGINGPSDLAFGHGLHRCLGAGLARMETQVAVQEAATTLPGLRLTEPDPPKNDLLSFNAPVRVLVRQSTRRAGGASST
ncbi:cytochrome P450 [Nocardioides pyridinolyticus]